jgi:hypothetical protein
MSNIDRGKKPHWVSKFPFIELTPPKNEKEKPQVRCNICSWKLGMPMKFQMKLETIEKHVGKVYENKIVDVKEKPIFKWKYYEKCRHVKYVDE